MANEYQLITDNSTHNSLIPIYINSNGQIKDMNPANIIRYGTKIIDNLSYTEGTLILDDGNEHSNWYEISISLPHSTQGAFWYLYIYYGSNSGGRVTTYKTLIGYDRTIISVINQGIAYSNSDIYWKPEDGTYNGMYSYSSSGRLTDGPPDFSMNKDTLTVWQVGRQGFLDTSTRNVFKLLTIKI